VTLLPTSAAGLSPIAKPDATLEERAGALRDEVFGRQVFVLPSEL
jgi:hypothetical protein